MNPLLFRLAQLLLLLIPAASILSACIRVPSKLPSPRLRDSVSLAGLQVPIRGATWPTADWWRSYHDKQLNKLMTQALKNSPGLAQAHARVQTAKLAVRLAAAQAGLNINGNIQISRQRMSQHGLIPPSLLGFTWYNQADLGMQIKYDFDWWGKKRAAIDAALDKMRAIQARRSAAALIIEKSLADTYFGWLADRHRLELARQRVKIQRQWLHIAQLRVTQGVDEPDTVHQAIARLVSARQIKLALQSSATLRKVSLAALLGVSLARLPPLSPRPLPTISGTLPNNTRIDLIARRPDITASRWQVEAALKQTEQTRAQFFPDFSLSALIGLSSINQGIPTAFGGNGNGGNLMNIFRSGSRVLGLTPAIHLPIFESGQLKAAYGVSRAQLNTAIRQYNSVVNDAAHEVASAALMAQQIAARRRQQARQLLAGQALLASARACVRQGTRDTRVRLIAHAQYLQQKDNAVALHAKALSTDLTLIKALGGGYHRPPRTPT